MFQLKANKEFKSKLKNRIFEEYKDFNLINVKDNNVNSFETGFNINIDFLDRHGREIIEYIKMTQY